MVGMVPKQSRQECSQDPKTREDKQLFNDSEIIKLKSLQGELLEVEPEVACMSRLIRTMVAGSSHCGGVFKEIPIPHVQTAVLNKVIEYCRYHKDRPPSEIPRPIKSSNLVECGVCEWDAQYVHISEDILFDLILAASYLDIKGLMDLMRVTLDSMMRAKDMMMSKLSEANEIESLRKENALLRDENAALHAKNFELHGFCAEVVCLRSELEQLQLMLRRNVPAFPQAPAKQVQTDTDEKTNIREAEAEVRRECPSSTESEKISQAPGIEGVAGLASGTAVNFVMSCDLTPGAMSFFNERSMDSKRQDYEVTKVLDAGSSEQLSFLSHPRGVPMVDQGVPQLSDTVLTQTFQSAKVSLIQNVWREAEGTLGEATNCCWLDAHCFDQTCYTPLEGTVQYALQQEARRAGSSEFDVTSDMLVVPLMRSKYLVLLMSPTYCDSPFCMLELAIWFELKGNLESLPNVFVLPVGWWEDWGCGCPSREELVETLCDYIDGSIQMFQQDCVDELALASVDYEKVKETNTIVEQLYGQCGGGQNFKQRVARALLALKALIRGQDSNCNCHIFVELMMKAARSTQETFYSEARDYWKDDLDAQKMAVVAGLDVPCRGTLRFYDPDRREGYISHILGRASEPIPEELLVEEADISTGAEWPRAMRDIGVEFSIWKTPMGIFKARNMMLPRHVPLTAEALKFRAQQVTSWQVELDSTWSGRWWPLSLDNKELQDSGVEYLSQALRDNTMIMKLSLCSNRIGDDGALSLAQVLKENRALDLLQLSHNCIGDSGAASLAEALIGNRTLKELGLGCNCIGQGGAARLAEALQGNCWLERLLLDGNGIGDGGTTCLAQALVKNVHLEKLSLGKNCVGDAGAKSLADALRKNRRLSSLELSSNVINAAGADALTEVLVSNHRLSELNLGGNPLGKGGQGSARARSSRSLG